MAKQPNPPETRRASGPLAVAALVDKVTRPMRRRRGLVEPALVGDWASIVGAPLARQCLPERLVRGPAGAGGTLHVRVDGPLALELQHLEPLVVERINGYFGYRAVARLALHQGPLPKAPEPKPPPPTPDPADAAAFEARLDGIDDAALRSALKGLGDAVLARSRESETD